MPFICLVIAVVLAACKPASKPVNTADLQKPLAPAIVDPCDVKPIKSDHGLAPEAQYRPCTAEQTSLALAPALRFNFQQYCSCGEFGGYCMVWKHGDGKAMGFTRASECGPKQCQSYFRSILGSYCEGRWLYQSARN